MAVVLVHQGPTLTQEKYDEVVQKLSDGGRLESPSDRAESHPTSAAP